MKDHKAMGYKIMTELNNHLDNYFQLKFFVDSFTRLHFIVGLPCKKSPVSNAIVEKYLKVV